MPVSHYKHIQHVMAAVESVENVKSVLDVGIGFGKYGVILRERFDIRFNRYDKKLWKTKIDGIDIYKPYITPMHKYIYNNLFIGDVRTIVGKLSNYDVIIFLDCIEHMNKNKGSSVLKRLVKKTNKLLLVSFPTTFNKNTNASWPNKRELHRCLWTKKDLETSIGSVNKLSPTLYSKVI